MRHEVIPDFEGRRVFPLLRAERFIDSMDRNDWVMETRVMASYHAA